MNGLLAGGMACHEVEKLLHHSHFAASEHMNKCSLVILEMNALIMSTSTILGSSLYCLEKQQMYSRRVSLAFCL
jgi:hypothetical protein